MMTNEINGGVRIQTDIEYASHPGLSLVGDLYMPPEPHTRYPVLVAVHGGGWQGGDRKSFAQWGTYLAQRGYALFAIKYRLVRKGAKAYPDAADDVREAIRFVRAKADILGIDPQRVGLLGTSAGAHLAALTALAGREKDPGAVKLVVASSGIYDMKAQWDHELIARPRNNLVEKFLGVSPMEDRGLYFETSPISHATIGNNQVAFLLGYGLQDDVVPSSQSTAFLLALNQAGFYARSVVAPEAGHFWLSEPIEESHSAASRFAPMLLRFLAERL
ncbi:MAG: esterase/lipase [Noviherbaspirillum sp.]|jgi:acetyl esterase/lipase|nr:esterase/lipase [Noviherbaspirillum sp.]